MWPSRNAHARWPEVRHSRRSAPNGCTWGVRLADGAHGGYGWNPCRRSSASGDGEVIFRSNHPEFRLLEHPRHERVSARARFENSAAV